MAKKQTLTSSNEVSLNIKEAKQFLKHIVDNNRFLQSQGKLPVAVEVVGDSVLVKLLLLYS